MQPTSGPAKARSLGELAEEDAHFTTLHRRPDERHADTSSRGQSPTRPARPQPSGSSAANRCALSPRILCLRAELPHLRTHIRSQSVNAPKYAVFRGRNKHKYKYIFINVGYSNVYTNRAILFLLCVGVPSARSGARAVCNL